MKILVLFFFTISLFAEKIQIVYSSNLNGNLYSCLCGLKYSVGLVKRASYIKSKKFDSNSLFLDTGNSFQAGHKLNKSQAILDSFERMNYSGLGLGSEDLNYIFKSKEIFKNTFFKNKVLSSNIDLKKMIGTEPLSTKFTSFNFKTSKFKVFSHFSLNNKFELDKEAKEELIFKDYKDTIPSLISNDSINILLHYGSIVEAKQIKKDFPSLIIISSAVDSTENKNGKIDSIYSTSDKLGDVIGVIYLEVEKNKIVKESSEIFKMDYKKITDDDSILKILDKYKLKQD
jgi:hypothetical protein